MMMLSRSLGRIPPFRHHHRLWWLVALLWHPSILLLQHPIVAAQEEVLPSFPFLSSSEATTIALDQCSSITGSNKRSSSDLNLKSVYKVGVLGNRGIDALYKEYNLTFADYLTKTVGERFEPPIRFEIEPLLFGEQSILDKAISSDHVDFTFMNPALFSCVESEVNANSLATFITRRVVNGEIYEMSQFGGVIFVHINNTNVYSVKDIVGKRVATTSVTSLGSGQTQFRELQKSGLNHFQSPRQLIMMESQSRVVEAVLLGEVDVGFVRTDQLERTIDPQTQQPLDVLSNFRIVADQKGALLDTGEPFPVALSTPLYPEWNFGSLPHVPSELTRQVQESLFEMSQHATIAKPLQQCYTARNCSLATVPQQCQIGCYLDLDATLMQETQCTISMATTNPEIATLALEAMTNAKCAGWIPSKSYMTIRNMQEETGFIQTTLTADEVRCTRTTEIVDAVVCPPNYFRRSREEILTGCQTAGLDCYGFQCLCSPCVQAYDVDFFPVMDTSTREDSQQQLTNMREETMGTGCSKFSICGQVRQGEQIQFRLVDNQKRADAKFWANVFITEQGETYNMTPPTPNTTDNNTSIVSREFTFDATGRPTGIIIVQVNVNNQQIPESPFRFRIIPPWCESPFEPSPLGECVCPNNTVTIFGQRCLRLWMVLPIALMIGVLVVGLVIWFIIHRKRKKMDSIWKVDKTELHFDDPPKILGNGTFGYVLLGEYRGTAVAVKRVLPDNSAASAAWMKNKHKGKKKSNKRDNNDNQQQQQQKGDDLVDKMETGETEPDIGMRSVFVTGSVGRESIGRSSTGGGGGSPSGSGKGFWGLFGGSSGVSIHKLKRDFVKEMRTLSKLRHPSIVATLGAVMESYEPPTLLMEYMELGSLYDLLHNDSMVLGGETLLPMLQDIAQGLRFLHSAKPKIIHGDIKSANILVDGRFHAKVADFGLTSKGGVQSGQAAGTPFWMAPELLRGETGNNATSDVYAFGITLSEILSRKDPFHGELHLNVIDDIKDPEIHKIPKLPAQCPEEAKELMLACLRPNPKDRPTAQDIDVRVKMFEQHKFDAGFGNKRRLNNSQSEADLLSQLFPKHVADALREGRTVEPENHECCTVYFSDVVGYTEISSTLSPAKVSSLLHRLYSKFDNLCEQYDLFKVETVGDAYMVATLNESNTKDNHVALVARFAFDAVAAAASTLIDEDDPKRGYVQIRVGFHSGPVVTHVVGHRNPRYSVIGDVVNTASRMETNSAPGRITTSKFSAQLLKKQFPQVTLKTRGKVQVKGKGKMNIFWVEPPSSFVCTSTAAALRQSTASASTAQSSLLDLLESQEFQLASSPPPPPPPPPVEETPKPVEDTEETFPDEVSDHGGDPVYIKLVDGNQKDYRQYLLS